VSQDSSWRLGASESLINRLYDGLRRGLNRDLVAYLNREALAGKPNCRVLEAGSGTAFASSVLRLQSNVTLAAALDHDPEALTEGRKRDPQLIGVTGDLGHIPFADETFDLVWNSSTLEHLPDPLAALREMARVTRRGGCVFVGVPYIAGPLGFQRFIADTSAGVWIGTVFSRAQLAALMESAGLQPRASLTYFLRFFIGIAAAKP
jgi:ubiquinone/menaquinone biosynthesis C-methylase UbiE